MMTFALLVGGLCVGGLLGYWLATILHKDIPTRPDVLTATPEEIVAVYEARREGERRGGAGPRPDSGNQARQGNRKGLPLQEKDLEKWEREQARPTPPNPLFSKEGVPKAGAFEERGDKGEVEKWEREQNKREKRRARS